MKSLYFTMCLHQHQPVGNFDHVFERNYRDAYLPFLEIIASYPDIPFTLHYSGSLLEWIEHNHPEFFDFLIEISQKGNIELFGGAFYEPILSMLPDRDSKGQIQYMQRYIKKHFNQEPAGYWLTERVWEQPMVKLLADMGIQYTLIDDYHLKNAGIIGENLSGYYLTEDQGKIISVFPSDEDLRYMIPFAPPDVVVNYLIEKGNEEGTRLLVYGDDGEKFGGWPGTKTHVYRNKWLIKFLNLLRENKEKIKVLTVSEAYATIKPLAKVYIPDSSYREMMEWALPLETGIIYERSKNRLKNQIHWDENKLFFKGGYWRNFKHKYPEANRLYAKMMEVSEKLNSTDKNAPGYSEAEKLLYKAQCNCPYWHGVFGGLYLNHLRFGTYKNLIEADNIISEVRNEKNIMVEKNDFDFDGRDEIQIKNQYVKLYLKPDEGGTIYELDLLKKGFNVVDTMTRKPEIYHSDLFYKIQNKNNREALSIHDLSKVKDKNLYKEIVYDWYARNYLIDHFFPHYVNLTSLEKNNYKDMGDFTLNNYIPEINRGKDSVEIILTRNGHLFVDNIRYGFKVQKAIRLLDDSPKIFIHYKLENLSEENLTIQFGIEFNYSMLAGNAPDRYYWFGTTSQKGGRLGKSFLMKNQNSVGITDEWQNLNLSLSFSLPASVYGIPIKTISRSETQYEKVYQSSALIPIWNISINSNGQWEIEIVQDFTDFK